MLAINNYKSCSNIYSNKNIPRIGFKDDFLLKSVYRFPFFLTKV